ncbi:MAG: hypothetical protein K5634_05145 [Sphaerochaetaceae bacterium]|nr:hypothetical protein [Sphaerochaetaceae bacterium]
MSEGKKDRILGWVLIVMIILAACIDIYNVAFSKAVLVTDSSWDMLMPASEIRELKFELAGKGSKLVCVSYEDFFEKPVEASLYIFTPVSSAAAIKEGKTYAQELGGVVIGITGRENFEAFDVVLISDDSGELPEGVIDYRYSANKSAEMVHCPDLDTSILPFTGKYKSQVHGTTGILVYETREK